jgi:hypothetical protein
MRSMYEAALSEPEHWFALVSTVDDTDVMSNERLAIDHREWMKLYGGVQGDAFFRQEYFCEFDAPILGAVYADALKDIEAEGRICPLKIEPGIPVHTAWDLGVSDSTAIWFITWAAIIIWLITTKAAARAIGPLCRCVARKADQAWLSLCAALAAARCEGALTQYGDVADRDVAVLGG